jgi:hypothetical protein
MPVPIRNAMLMAATYGADLMKVMVRNSAGVATLLFACVALSACSTGSARMANGYAAPEPVNPVADSAVATASLPELGPDGAITTSPAFGQYPPNQYPPGQYPPGTQMGFPQSGNPGAYPPMGDPLGQPSTMVAGTDPSFVTLDAVGAPPNVAMRDLSGGLTVQKLLGGWTIVSGADQCRLNLTQTTKTGTQRYRASTPGCAMAGLKVVASWQLSGNQVQLYDENGDIIARLMLSGNRFIGALASGQGLSMVG